MISASTQTFVSARSLSHALMRSFPMPKMLVPPAAGIDISDSSIKWLVLEGAEGEYCVRTFGEIRLESGIVQNGVVQDIHRLAESLAHVKHSLGGIALAHAALPEEAAYVFGMQVPARTPRDQILKMIEFEFEGRVPIPPAAAVYDYNRISSETASVDEIGVVVFPMEVSEAYAEAFAAAGITLLSLEVEASSIARAVSARTLSEPITLLVDFGRARTGFAVIKRGVPIFTSTVEVGGDAISRVLVEKLSLSPDDAAAFKNTEGLRPKAGPKSPGLEAIMGTVSALADEVARHYHYWDTRRNERGERMTPVSRVILVGGNANLNGLADYISGRVQAPTAVGNVWRNVASFDTYIPPIERHESLQYATAIGLALRGM